MIKGNNSGKVAQVIHSRCDNSPFCMVMRGCPQGIVKRRGGMFSRERPQVEKDNCRGCGTCFSHCPHGAVVMMDA